MLRNIKNTYHLILAILANVLYFFPSKSLKVIAITGTDGKTTSSTLLYHVLRTAGKNVALVSTVAAYIGDTQVDTGFHVTTPSSFALQKILRTIATKGMEYVVLEVTSHGIDQNRVWGIRPTWAGITNVTHEHLDYHKTYQNYVRTKAKILQKSQHAFINQDAKESFSLLKDILLSSQTTFEKYSVAKLSKKLKDAVSKRFPGQTYNFENTALVTAIATDIGVTETAIIKAIASFPGVPGRMEQIPNKKGIKIIVDFAHTPHALEEALRSLHPTPYTLWPSRENSSPSNHSSTRKKTGKLIVVFGCAGLRDISKRPLMGEIATRMADLVVLTAEDPRTEDVWSIIGQIKSGVKEGYNKLVSIADRAEAIRFAIEELATRGDTVIITGKGHEQSMCFGTTEYPWSDRKAVEEIL